MKGQVRRRHGERAFRAREAATSQVGKRKERRREGQGGKGRAEQLQGRGGEGGGGEERGRQGPNVEASSCKGNFMPAATTAAVTPSALGARRPPSDRLQRARHHGKLRLPGTRKLFRAGPPPAATLVATADNKRGWGEGDHHQATVGCASRPVRRNRLTCWSS